MADASPLPATSSTLTTDPAVTLPGDRPLLPTDPLANSSSRLTSSAATPRPAATATSKTAVFWRNAITGENRLWVTEGGNRTDIITLPTLKNVDWQIVGTTDYNRDGQADFLWRNRLTGEIKWWVMNGTAKPLKIALPTVTDFDWQIVSTADYNGDQKSDLLWRNIKTGDNAWWVTKGPDLQPSFDYVGIQSVSDLNWQIVGTDDYNRDQKVDLLWRNTKTGENAWWLMDGATLRAAIMLPTVADLSWTPVGTGDYNRDGQIDLLWQHKVGQSVWWAMNNDKIQGVEWLPSEPDLNWQIVGVQDHYTPFIAALQGPITTLTPNIQLQAAEASQIRNLAVGDFDLYTVIVPQSGIFTASLTELTGDADVRLIHDINGNSTIDDGEIKAWQWERGNKDETIRSFLNAGTYLVQVLGYNGQAAGYKLSTNFTPAASDSQKFAINLQYDTSLGGLSLIAQQAARAAADFWESVIPWRSAITNSNNLNITVSGRSLSYNTYAVAGPIFASDRQTVTIDSGLVYINTQRLSFFDDKYDYLKLVLIHEFAHVLGFGTLWEPVKFDTGNGTSLTVGKSLIDRNTATYNIFDSLGKQTYASWAYGDLLGSFAPTAVPLEADILAHWDETRFGVESLTPYAEAVGVRSPISALTVSALRDLGWHVNYGAAQAYQLSAPLAALTAQDPTTSTVTPTVASSQAALTATCGCRSCLAGLSLPLLGDTPLADGGWRAVSQV
jgi:FG-GAP-like repeat